MGKAKTASKNNPTQREKAKEIFFNGKKIKPVKFIGERQYMAAQYEDGALVMGRDGFPLPWRSVRS